MEAKIPKPVHMSYQKHRKDLAWKIILPVVLSAVLCIGLIVLINVVTFGSGGAISTMWIAIPTIIGMLIVLALLVGIIYLLAKLLHITPNYTVKVQDFFHLIQSYARRGADAVAKPIIKLDSIGAGINRFFGKR
jgi:hypothetical protein